MARPPARTRILAAATRLFLERGYAATSMEAVARRAGVSKATLYHHFPGKKELFAAIVEDRARTLGGEIDGRDRRMDVEARLRRFARRFVELVAGDETLALYRLVIAEGGRFPELARIFWAQGPARARRIVAEILEEGGIPEDGSRRAWAADRFLALLLGPWLVRALVGLERPDPAFLTSWAEEAVAIFLDRYGRNDGAPTSR